MIPILKLDVERGIFEAPLRHSCLLRRHDSGLTNWFYAHLGKGDLNGAESQLYAKDPVSETRKCGRFKSATVVNGRLKCLPGLPAHTAGLWADFLRQLSRKRVTTNHHKIKD